MDERLMDFLKKHIERGSDMDKVKQDLLNAGHDLKIVEEHMNHVLKEKKAKDFVKKHVEIGSDINKIKQVLLNAGYDIKIAEEYVSQAIDNRTKKQKIKKYATIGILTISIIISVIGFYFYSNYKKIDLVINETQLTKVEYQKNIEIFNKALISNDITVCDQIEDNKLKEECKRKFEYNMSGKTIDKTFESKGLLNRALINHNISLCIEIEDYTIRKQCEQILKI